MDQREILEKLSRKEISQEEAERLLAAEKPGVDEAPPPVQAKKAGMSGCVLALLIAVPVILLLLLGSCGALFWLTSNQVEERRDEAINEMRKIEKAHDEAVKEMRRAEKEHEEMMPAEGGMRDDIEEIEEKKDSAPPLRAVPETDEHLDKGGMEEEE